MSFLNKNPHVSFAITANSASQISIIHKSDKIEFPCCFEGSKIISGEIFYMKQDKIKLSGSSSIMFWLRSFNNETIIIRTKDKISSMVIIDLIKFAKDNHVPTYLQIENVFQSQINESSGFKNVLLDSENNIIFLSSVNNSLPRTLYCSGIIIPSKILVSSQLTNYDETPTICVDFAQHCLYSFKSSFIKSVSIAQENSCQYFCARCDSELLNVPFINSTMIEPKKPLLSQSSSFSFTQFQQMSSNTSQKDSVFLCPLCKAFTSEADLKFNVLVNFSSCCIGKKLPRNPNSRVRDVMVDFCMKISLSQLKEVLELNLPGKNGDILALINRLQLLIQSNDKTLEQEKIMKLLSAYCVGKRLNSFVGCISDKKKDIYFIDIIRML